MDFTPGRSLFVIVGADHDVGCSFLGVRLFRNVGPEGFRQHLMRFHVEYGHPSSLGFIALVQRYVVHELAVDILAEFAIALRIEQVVVPVGIHHRRDCEFFLFRKDDGQCVILLETGNGLIFRKCRLLAGDLHLVMRKTHHRQKVLVFEVFERRDGEQTQARLDCADQVSLSCLYFVLLARLKNKGLERLLNQFNTTN